MAQTVELRAGRARVAIAPDVGGAVAAFEFRGHPILRPTDAAAWASGDASRFSSYPLVPFSNRIAEATLHWAERRHALHRYLPSVPHAIHGNGWKRAWECLHTTPSTTELRLIHDAGGARAREWPFHFRARQIFALAPDTLTMTMEITNTSAVAFPFGLGWHPFFSRDATTQLEFSAAAMWETDSTRLPTELVAVPAEYDFGKPRAIADTTLDNCFAGWRPPARILWPNRGIGASITADPACGHLVVYVPSNADSVAVEPVTHMPDAFRRAALGEEGTGTRVLEPDETFSSTMRLCVQEID